MRIKSLYLAGPDLWAPDGDALIARKRTLCHGAGYESLTARDGDRHETEPTEASAREIYAGALANLRRSDAVIANLTPWRGMSCDSGTAFEAGFASALSKPIFAYINIADEDEADYRERVEVLMGASPDAAGVWRDPDGCEVEDFGLPEHLMLWAEARRFYIIVTPDPLADTTGLEMCLEALREYAD
jgi:nucleoside 2-deoxyribosyltransferase